MHSGDDQTVGQLVREAAHPFRWMAAARNLLTSAKVLRDAVSPMRAWSEPLHADVAIPAPTATEADTLGPGFLLLLGFAIENALKAALSAQLGDARVQGQSDKKPGNLNDAFKSHDLVKLAATAGVRVDGPTNELLTRLHVFLLWAARYPVSLSEGEMRRFSPERATVVGERVKARLSEFVSSVPRLPV